jgi:hypothetical protein
MKATDHELQKYDNFTRYGHAGATLEPRRNREHSQAEVSPEAVSPVGVRRGAFDPDSEAAWYAARSAIGAATRAGLPYTVR